MNTIIETRKEGVNILCLYDLTTNDRLYLNAWLFAFGINETDRIKLCHSLYEEGELLFSNIKHHITVHCKKKKYGY
mgnify:CR=1 FL=1